MLRLLSVGKGVSGGWEAQEFNPIPYGNIDGSEIWYILHALFLVSSSFYPPSSTEYNKK